MSCMWYIYSTMDMVYGMVYGISLDDSSYGIVSRMTHTSIDSSSYCDTDRCGTAGDRGCTISDDF